MPTFASWSVPGAGTSGECDSRGREAGDRVSWVAVDGRGESGQEGAGVSTKERLAKAMEDAGCPANLIARARGGEFDDFESESATPIIRLVRTLSECGFSALATRAMNGEFDATKEEAEAWYEREGKHLLL